MAYNNYTQDLYKTKLRQCIYKFVSKDNQLLSGEVEINESYFRGKRKGSRERGANKFKSYDGLVIYGFKHERIDKSVKFTNGKVCINGI